MKKETMKRREPKLRIHSETLRRLEPDQERAAMGGSGFSNTGIDYCPLSVIIICPTQ